MNPLITVIGPTAIGKSDLAVSIALYIKNTYGIDAEIISADSRQIYKHLDIGTGKITTEEMKGIPHHMLDIIEPNDTSYSVFRYAEDVQNILRDIYNRGAIPILCGGTGFYIDAIIFGNTGAEMPPHIEFQKELEAYPLEELAEKLQTIALEKKRDISHVDIKNKRRIIRALDILEHDGVFAQKNTTQLYNVLHIGLDTTTEKLRERIQKRLDARIQAGMLEESQKLLNSNILTHERMQKLGLEYKFMSQLLTHDLTLPECIEKLFFAIWHYAKRQRVWFKKYIDVHWLDAELVKENPKQAHDLVDVFFSQHKN